jgi:hypothetical protein
MFSLSMTFYLFPKAFRSWGSVKRGPTYFTCLLKTPVHYHSDIYSPILPHEEGYGIQAFSRYLCLVQQNGGGAMGEVTCSLWLYCAVLRLYVLHRSYFTAVLSITYFLLESVPPYEKWGEITAVCTGYTLLATLGICSTAKNHFITASLQLKYYSSVDAYAAAILHVFKHDSTPSATFARIIVLNLSKS